MAILSYYLRMILFVPLTIYYSLKCGLAMVLGGNRPLFYSAIRQWSRKYLPLYGIRQEVTGMEHVVPGKSYIIVANHASEFDIPLLIDSFRQIDVKYIYKQELEKIPVFGWAVRKSPFIGVDREDPRNAMGSIDAALKSFGDDEASVIIFPEGTRSLTGEMQPFKRGAFMLAARAGMELLPVAISGSFGIKDKKRKRINPSRVRVVISAPVAPPAEPDSRSEKQLMAQIKETIETMLAAAGEKNIL
jgi:1-acyl-sn-glycerol-3-phosphate acyltransferase